MARSVSIAWPDDMTRAVFFADDACEYLGDDDGGGRGAAHVERGEDDDGWGGEQCVAVGLGGGWGSVMFLREGEWEGFLRGVLMMEVGL